MRKCTVVTLSILSVLGILLVIAGVVLIFENPKIIRHNIEQSVILKNGSASFKSWKDPNAKNIYMQFYVFHVENPEQVIEGREKPNVTQRGPYTYREVRSKEDVAFEQDGTVLSYRQPKTYVFDESLSSGPDNETFMTVNLPILTAAAMLEKKVSSHFVLSLISNFLSYEEERLFEEHTVKEFLWGYRERTLEKINDITEKYLSRRFFNSTVGIFTGGTANGTNDGLYSIFTGSDDVWNVNVIEAWNGKPNLTFWKTPTCNMINGTDGARWHPYVETSDRLYIFSSDICRSIYVEFNGTSTVHGIKTKHFVPPPAVFMDHVQNPDNIGFCVPQCLESGVLDVSVCKKAPIVMSMPHFYQGSPTYINAIIGMNPGEQYSTFMDIEPYTGAALRVAKQLQLNAKITKLRAFKDTAKFNLTIFPMIWLNENGHLDKSGAEKFSAEVIRPMQILEGVQYGLLALGLLILLCVIIYVIQYYVRRSSEDPPLIEKDDTPRGDI